MTVPVSLTELQQQFVVHFTSTSGCIGNAAAAARSAGYSEASAKEIGAQLLHKPHIRAAVDQANREALSGRIATKAVQALEEILDRRDELPPRVVADAARTVLDRAGYSQPVADRRAERASGATKPDHVKTLAELDAELEEARRRRDAVAAGLKVVEGAAVLEPVGAATAATATGPCPS